ncbi:MAG: oligoendopeptidase F [Streptococcaceae bacterium]|jgi:oligoendopeptidase F|nr:oligoendopeptidase F [Streptococcaceae bacterium]
MAKRQEIRKRNEVAEKDTWDLSLIFKDEQAWESEFKRVEGILKESAQYKGTLKDGSEAIFKTLQHFENLYRPTEKLYVYASMKNDEDTANSFYQGMQSRAKTLYVNASESMSWFEPELLSLTDEEIKAMIEENEELTLYKYFLEQITSNREHVLSNEGEALLASVSELFNGPGETFSILNNADLRFPMVQDEERREVQLTHGLYRQFLESFDREVRKDAFQKMYQTYGEFQHTLASTLSYNVKTDNVRAKVRNFDSARQAAMHANHIPETVFDTLLNVVHEHLPLLHRYVALRKRVLGVDTLHNYDLHTPIVDDVDFSMTYDEAKEKALVALAPLGEEYVRVVKEAFDNRWVDVYENQGKRSGAYSGGAYDTAPYMLMNWHDALDQLYTLVHETGHSLHSYFTRSNQPFIYGDYSIFLAEIASTTNENILTEHLLQTETDPLVRAYILNHFLDGFKGTIFRQTQFAEFEHFMHTQQAAGIPLTSDMLNDAYGKLNAKYYGDALVRDEEIALEWARIPHFYYNYYVYQYATGFAAASALSKKIVQGNPKDLEKYLDYLKAGSSDAPLNVIQKAGVNMEEETYLRDAFKLFEERLDELEKLIG